MGKSKKPVLDKDENQKKISTFFQKPSAAKSALFTEHGCSGNKSSSNSRTAIKPVTSRDVISVDDEDEDDKTDFKCRKPPENVSVSRLNAAAGNSVTMKEKDINVRVSAFCTDSAVIPETQLLATPEGKMKKAGQLTERLEECGKSPENGQMDIGIIPATPDSLEEKQKAKRPLARSFLLSSSRFASNPIQEAKENREAKLAMKKNAALARKGGFSVSVNFPEQINSSSGTVQETSMDLMNGFSSCIVNGGKDSSYSSIQQVDNVAKADPEIVTPTKVYPEVNTVKRMAKPGLSPEAKRLPESECASDIKNGTHKFTVMKNLEFNRDAAVDEEMPEDEKNRQSVKEMNQKVAEELERVRKLKEAKQKRLEEEKNQRIEEAKGIEKQKRKKNNEKMLKYQLDGDTGAAGRDVSVKGDTHLDAILHELHSPSLLRAPHSQDCREVISVKQGPQKTLAPKVSAVKKYSLEGVLRMGDESKDSEENGFLTNDMVVMETKVSAKGRQKVSCEGTRDLNKSAIILDCKLNKRFDVNDGPCSVKADEDLEDVICELNSPLQCKGIDKKKDAVVTKNSRSINRGRHFLLKESITSERPSHTTDEVNNTEASRVPAMNTSPTEDDIEVDIVVDPTPCCVATEGSRTQVSEMEIDEFMSQSSDSLLLCEEMEKLSQYTYKADALQGQGQTEVPCVQFGRHVVTQVAFDSNQQTTSLSLSSQPDEIQRTCILHGFWLDTQVQEGDMVHVLAPFQDCVCHVTDTEGLLVVNPDLLLSGTTVVSSVFCMRRSILKEKFKGCDSRNVQMLYGSIIHSVFQQVLRKKILDGIEIQKEAEAIVRQSKTLLEIYANSVDEDQVLQEIKNYIPQIVAWTKRYTNIGQDVIGNQRPLDQEVLVTKVSDIEENIWSPRFGIKGKIDLTVEVQLKKERRKKVIPLELKTGRTTYSVEHKGQVTLYSMMCSDRRTDPGTGLLLYLKEPSMKLIPADWMNQRGLVQLRNEMAYYISRQVFKSVGEETTFSLGRLPDPISNLRACQKCPQLINCAIYQKQVESRLRDGDGMSGLVSETLGHLTPDHMVYFSQWCLMLDLESQLDRSKKTVADIWCKSAAEREASGQCFSSMVVVPGYHSYEESDDTIIVSFRRQDLPSSFVPLTSHNLNEQDSVVVSCQQPSWIAVCTGFIHRLSTNQVTLLTDSDVVSRLETLKDKVFRIDKCDNFSTAGIFYTNISRLMNDDHRSCTLRRLIIDRVQPELQNTLSKSHIEKVKAIFKSLNKLQKKAILKVLMCKDYVLIKGYPGSGKTSTIIALVKVLHTLGMSVLLTSYTHSAVDNILLKLKKDGIPFLRLGRVSKIHRDIQQFSAERLTRSFTSKLQLETFLNSQPIVATSCLGTNHPMFSHRQFDFCIVDEASQVLQPACLGPLFVSGKFVLVGDPEQLPPVVQSKEARQLGMDESLFLRLDRQGVTFELNIQYRMNKMIQDISNHLVYNGRMSCGSEQVAQQTLASVPTHQLHKMVDSEPWLATILDSSISRAVVFLDTHKISAPEMTEKGGVVKNEKEAEVVLKIVSALRQAAVQASDIGVIAPYRSQVTLIRSMAQGQPGSHDLEVNTVDQYQGRDKDVIIISFVKSTQQGGQQTGELLKDMRRLNVAVTRAKKKLILLGNTSTLRQYTPLERLIDFLQQRDQIVSL